MDNIWQAQIMEMFSSHNGNVCMIPPELLPDPIDLLDDDRDGECGESVIFWEKWLAAPSSMAVIKLKKYSNSDDFFKKGFNSTARNRARYAQKLGYSCRVMNWDERNARLDELYAINTSMNTRQGMIMRNNYTSYPQPVNYSQECDKHFKRLYGVFNKDNIWVGYIVGVFVGELVAAGQILGHGGYMKDGFMYLLWKTFITDVMDNYPDGKYIVYSRWGDGTDGLRYWKYSVGMRPYKYFMHKAMYW